MPSRFVRAIMTGIVATAGLSACVDEQPVEVLLPPKGDAVRGREVFLRYECQTCHAIPDVDLPGAASVEESVLPLGVRMHRARDYGDLLTSVIYPDHVVSPKYVAAMKASGRGKEAIEMPDFTETMTVSELVDVVEFLHAQYSRLLSRQYQGKGSPPRSRLERRRDD